MDILQVSGNHFKDKLKEQLKQLKTKLYIIYGQLLLRTSVLIISIFIPYNCLPHRSSGKIVTRSLFFKI